MIDWAQFDRRFASSPGVGLNGDGANGSYYDWSTGTYRSTSTRSAVSWESVFNNIVTPNSITYLIFENGTINKNGDRVGNGNFGIIKQGIMSSDGTFPTFNSISEASNYIGAVDFSLGRMYEHFQFGGGKSMTINMSSIDFGDITQEKLGVSGMDVGQSRPVNLFNVGPLNQAALAFGRVSMIYHGNDLFSIVGDNSSRFDFCPLIDRYASFERNAGNILGATINYNLLINPAAILVPSIFGGPYDVNFVGTTKIRK